MSILGGPAATIINEEMPSGGPRGASWGPDDTIVFATSGPSGLWRVSSDGGEPEELTTPDRAQGDHRWPEILPGGEAVLFAILPAGRANGQIAVLSLDSRETKVLVSGGSQPRYAPTGHIVYSVGETLRAVGFDLATLEVTSDPVPVHDGVATDGTVLSDYAISQNGSLVYNTSARRDTVAHTLVWVDREGNEEVLAAEPRNYIYPRISPDGTRVALDIRDQEQDIWVWDFARETLTRLTFDPGLEIYPTWTPDGRRIAYGLVRTETVGLFWKAADGTGAAELLADSISEALLPQTFSLDGTQLLFSDLGDSNLHVHSIENGNSEPLLATEFFEMNAEISPDGHWLAFQSSASGEFEIYVRPYPDVHTGRWQISKGGGERPLWAPDGRELFYLSPSGHLTAVSITTDPFVPGNPERVLERTYFSRRVQTDSPVLGRTYDVSPDGKRFLMIKERGSGDARDSELIVVENWLDELKRLVPVGK